MIASTPPLANEFGRREATRLTCTGGGTALISLREGRRHAVAILCRPAIVITHPRLLGEVGYAGSSSNDRQGPVAPVREEPLVAQGLGY